MALSSSPRGRGGSTPPPNLSAVAPMDALPAATSTILLSMRHRFPCVAAAPQSPPTQRRMRPSHMWQIDLRPMAEVTDAPRRVVPGVSTSPPLSPWQRRLRVELLLTCTLASSPYPFSTGGAKQAAPYRRRWVQPTEPWARLRASGRSSRSGRGGPWPEPEQRARAEEMRGTGRASRWKGIRRRLWGRGVRGATCGGQIVLRPRRRAPPAGFDMLYLAQYRLT